MMQAVNTSTSSSEHLLDTHIVIQHQLDTEGVFDLPAYPKMNFDDIFREPSTYRDRPLGNEMLSCITDVFGKTFNYVQSATFYILVMLTGLFLSLSYGIVFGIFMYTVVWIVHPVYKLFHVMLRLLSAIIRPLTRVLWDPVFESVGKSLRDIHGTVAVHHNRTV